MCTTVVGGSIHRAATRISTAIDQRSATPMRNHRTKDRRVPFRCGLFGGVSGFSVTLQNNRLGWIDIAPGRVGPGNFTPSPSRSLLDCLQSHGSCHPVRVAAFRLNRSVPQVSSQRTLARMPSLANKRGGSGNEGEGAGNLRGPRCSSPKTLEGRRRTDAVPANPLIGIMWRPRPFACIPSQNCIPGAT